MPVIELKGRMIPYTIARSRRRSLAATVTADGALAIKAPYLLPDFLVRRFLHSRADWIINKVEERQRIQQTSESVRYDNGELLHFFDKMVLIMVTESEQTKRTRLYYLDNTFQIIVKPGLAPSKRQKEIKQAIHNWYRNNVKEELTRRVNHYARIMNAEFNTIYVKDVSSHWGSCSIRRNLNFNYRLAMIPVELADYVIIHELCHLTEMNHSANFWNLVGKYLPDYKVKRSRLKKLNVNVD
jgi:predicted metal-dependent hydrolase